MDLHNDAPARVTPFGDPRVRFLAGRFGMSLFLISLGMLFAASLVGLFVVRWQLALRKLWPGDLPPLPDLLWVSTGVLIVSSISLQWGLNSVRRGRNDHLRSGLLITLLLGVLFLLLQMRCWLTWLGPISQRWIHSDEYRFALTSFFVLTGLHALHVVGGLIPMAIVTRNAYADAYSPSHFAGVHYTTMYWHFLGVVWLVLYAAMGLALGR